MWRRIFGLWNVVRGDARLLWRALRHPRAPLWLKLAVAGLVAYVIWPLDLVPDFLGPIGWIDDLVLVPLVIRFLLQRLPAALREEIGRSPP